MDHIPTPEARDLGQPRGQERRLRYPVCSEDLKAQRAQGLAWDPQSSSLPHVCSFLTPCPRKDMPLRPTASSELLLGPAGPAHLLPHVSLLAPLSVCHSPQRDSQGAGRWVALLTTHSTSLFPWNPCAARWMGPKAESGEGTSMPASICMAQGEGKSLP